MQTLNQETKPLQKPQERPHGPPLTDTYSYSQDNCHAGVDATTCTPNAITESEENPHNNKCTSLNQRRLAEEPYKRSTDFSSDTHIPNTFPDNIPKIEDNLEPSPSGLPPPPEAQSGATLPSQVSPTNCIEMEQEDALSSSASLPSIIESVPDSEQITKSFTNDLVFMNFLLASLRAAGERAKENNTYATFIKLNNLQKACGMSPTAAAETVTTDTPAEPPRKQKKRTYSKTAMPAIVPTSNSFAPLEQTLETENPPDDLHQEEEPSRATGPEERCPPIVLHEPDKWSMVSSRLREKNIKYLKAKTTSAGINIYASTIKDFRAMITLLEQTRVQFHFYKLRSEKPLRLVIRGLPAIMDLGLVEDDLKQKGYDDFQLTRFTAKDGKTMPLIFLVIPKKHKRIYQESVICDLLVQIESRHKRASLGQCHRCQNFGHAQSGCRAAYRCLKCAEPHSTHLCKKSKETPAKCANCSGDHPANFPDCRENPRNKQPQHETHPTPESSAQPAPQPTYPAWRAKPSANRTQAPPLSSSDYPALSNTAANLPPSNKSSPSTGTRTDDIAWQIGSIILQFRQLNPSQDQLSTLVTTVTCLAQNISV